MGGLLAPDLADVYATCKANQQGGCLEKKTSGNVKLRTSIAFPGLYSKTELVWAGLSWRHQARLDNPVKRRQWLFLLVLL